MKSRVISPVGEPPDSEKPPERSEATPSSHASSPAVELDVSPPAPSWLPDAHVQRRRGSFSRSHDEPLQAPENRGLERRVVLFASLPSFLIGCTSTAYLPALPSIQEEFSTTSLQISATLTGYMAVQATTPMLWGPISDRVGRRAVLLGAMVWFTIASVLCAVAPNIAALIAFRVLQSFGISPTVVCGAGAIADVVPAERRGTAMGVFGLLQLIGPAVGPVAGGVIARAVGWRFIFVWLAATAALIALLVFLGLPETLPELIRKRAARARARLAAAAAAAAAASDAAGPREEEQAPGLPFWEGARRMAGAVGARCARSFVILAEKEILVLAFVGAASFAACYAFLSTLPALAAARYGLDQLMTGVLLLPFCLGCTLGSFVGGRAADYARRRALEKGGRFLGAPLAVAGGAFVNTACLIFLGASMEAGLALLALSSGLMGFWHTFTRPGLQSTAIEMHPRESAATAAVLTSVQYAFGAAASLVSSEAARAIGFGPYFACLAGMMACAGALALLLALRFIRPKRPAGAPAGAPAAAAPERSSSSSRPSKVSPLPLAPPSPYPSRSAAEGPELSAAAAPSPPRPGPASPPRDPAREREREREGPYPPGPGPGPRGDPAGLPVRREASAAALPALDPDS
eukprot:tig00021035_g17242.t1